MIQRRTENKENAVSPVVGVMLMLVVTIVIAAVVTLFATGVLGDVKTTPTAIIDSGDLTTVHFVKNAGTENPSPYDSLNSVDLWHKGGSDLYLSEIELQLQSYGSTQHYTKERFTVSSRSNKFTSGDKLSVNVDGCAHAPGTPVTWTLIDLNSGNKIASGDFIVPAATQTVIVPSLTAEQKTSIANSSTKVTIVFSVPSSYEGYTATLTDQDGYTYGGGVTKSKPVGVVNNVGVAEFENVDISLNNYIDGSVNCKFVVTATKTGSPDVSASCTVTVKPEISDVEEGEDEGNV
ncbi:MAG TPA: type IV pilin [Methanocorpusculum sp.]|nr:type IV pilin [Methanocorpusculum sp.]